MTVRSLVPGRARTSGARSLRLVRAEIMKISTTRSWWLFLAGFTLLTGAALTSNGFSHHYQLYPQQDLPDRAQALARAVRARTPAGVAAIAASMMTSGQVLSVLFAMLLGMRAATDEFAHRTAAATFMTVPRRARVIVAKLTAAACLGALFWLVAAVVSAVTTVFYLYSQHVSASLTGGAVIRPVLLSLLAFVAWAILGVSLGVLIRGPAAAVIAGLASYAGGFAAAQLLSRLIYSLDAQAWILGAPVIAPAVATDVMMASGRAFPHAPPPWVGALIMAGYALAITAAAITVIRRRDVT